MLQYLYGETEVAAQEIVDAVVPAADEVTKEEIAEAAAEKAENIADAVAEAAAEAGEKMDEETYSDLVMATAQCIYTETMAQLATAQACYAMESLFCDEAVEEYYAEQETYGEKWNKVKGHLSAKKHHYIAGAAGAASATAGAIIADKIAQKKGYSRKKARIVGALVGGAAGTAGGYATTKAGRDLYKAGGRRVAGIFKKEKKA